MNKKYILYLVTGIVSFALFYNSLGNDFVFDDESVVQNNLSIQSLSNIPKFFTADEGFHKVIGRYYRPLVSSTYAIDYAIWGLNPYGFHLTNILIHVISCLLLLSILIRLFAKYEHGLLAALIGALVFAAHPIHTEAVSWISGRTDSLVTLFFFASFLMYMKFTEDENGKLPMYLSLLFFVLGLLSKEMIVTMPVFILLYDFVLRKKDIEYFKKNLAAYIAFAAVTLIFLFVRYLLLKDIPDREAYLYFYGKDSATAFFTMMKTIPVYFKLLLYPVNLLYHYNGTIPDASSLGDVKVIVSLLFVLAFLVFAFYLFKKHSVYSFAILFFLVSLLPVLNIVPTMNLMAERFLYISSFALTLAVSYAAACYINDKNRIPVAVVALIIVSTFVFLTFNRNEDWKNNDTLYSTADGIDGNVLLVNAGNIYANKKNYPEAEKRYRRAIEIRDNSILAHHNLGLIFLLSGKIDSAEIKFKKGLEIDSLAPDGYLQLSNIYQQRGEDDKAINMLEKLQTIVPNYRNSAELLAMLKQGGIRGTLEGSNLPEELAANQISILEKRSFNYYRRSKFEEALSDLNKLVELNPSGRSGYYNNIALCYTELKNQSMAKEFFLKALDADGKNINALNGMADIYEKEKNIDKAVEMYNKILEISPDDGNAKSKLESLRKK